MCHNNDMSKQTGRRFVVRERLCDALLYTGGLFLVLEWIYPIPFLTHTDNITIFAWAFVLFFVVAFMNIAPSLRFMLRVLIIMGALFLGFPTDAGQSWFSYMVQELIDQPLSILSSGNLANVTDFYRTFLFLIVLSLVSHVLFYWIVYGRRILSFVVITIVFVIIVDATTVYDAGVAVMRIFAIGTFLFMFIRFTEQYRQMKHVNERKGLFGVMTLGILCMMGALLTGYTLPKAAPVFSFGTDNRQSGEGMKSEGRTGYGEDDLHLGGPLMQDETHIFRVWTSSKQAYLKGETKNMYTGTGWDLIASEEGQEQGRFVEPSLLEQNVRTDIVSFSEEKTATFLGQGPDVAFDHIFYPGQLQSSSVVGWRNTEDEDVYNVRIDPLSSKVRLENGEAPPGLYDVVYRDATYDFAALKEYDIQYDFEDENIWLFTLLPEELPDRIKEKAQEIVGEETHPYTQAKAIESYLKGPDFHYETDDVPILEEGKDYVDQFLFDTQRGYCEQFSTAMAVMLRTLDVPTRWVKGFAGGEKAQLPEEDMLQMGREGYLIKNRHAHTWVEVYFPEVGWIPFEPTPGFAGFSHIAQSDSDDEAKKTPDTPDGQDEQAASEQLEDAGKDTVTKEDKKSLSIDLTLLLAVFVVFMSIVVLVVNTFYKTIVRFFAQRRFQQQMSPTSFKAAYMHLLWVLHVHGYERGKPQTLTEYAAKIDEAIGGDHMRSLTAVYEQYVYGGRVPNLQAHIYEKHWKMMLAKIKP